MYIIPVTIQQGAGGAKPLAQQVSHLVSPPNGGTVYDGSSYATATCDAWISGVPAARNPLLDLTFNCLTYDSSEKLGVLNPVLSVLGTWINTSIVASPLVVSTSIAGIMHPGVIVASLPFEVTLTLKPDDAFIPFASVLKLNWVQWSDIGSLSFTVGKDNVAGSRPVDWPGYVYAVKKLLGRVAVYGENGVSFLTPSGSVFGLETIYRVGLLGKHAVTGDNTKHFFVDKSGQMWKVTGDSFKLIDYSEYLSQMNSSIVMSYDSMNNMVYICDGVLGFVYDTVSGSIGKCSPSITGFSYQSGVQYVSASEVISTDAFEICTDIYDLGTRAGKTLFSLELGTDLTTGLYAAIDYRRDKAGSFTTTPWYTVSATGRVYVIAWGREFRIRIKTLSYEYFELDYIKVNGVADAY